MPSVASYRDPPYGTTYVAIYIATRHAVCMLLPSPAFRRLATLVVIDDEERVALLRCSRGTSAWTLPEGTVHAQETYAEAAIRLSAHCFAGHPLRWGSVVGCRLALPPVHGSPAIRTERRVSLARTKRSAAPPVSGKADATRSMRWVPTTSLDDVLLEPYEDTTATLVAGYLEGWLPDGRITLH
ncbi:NUDIX hydrolase [Streptomyces sp. NPDC056160]|uniref:NUDIX hydrolase n=1 Tax=Streptomyces sp. NPDC056160 TaxID=3345731 RepID=UPI0035DA19DC